MSKKEVESLWDICFFFTASSHFFFDFQRKFQKLTEPSSAAVNNMARIFHDGYRRPAFGITFKFYLASGVHRVKWVLGLVQKFFAFLLPFSQRCPLLQKKILGTPLTMALGSIRNPLVCRTSKSEFVFKWNFKSKPNANKGTIYVPWIFAIDGTFLLTDEEPFNGIQRFVITSEVAFWNKQPV